MPPTISLPKATSVRSGFSLFSGVRMIWSIITYAIILSILVTAIIIAVQHKDINPGLQYLGNRTLLVTENLNNQSLQVIENKGLYQKGDSFVINVWNFCKSIWKFLMALFLIYFWLKVLSWIFMKVIIMDDSKSTSSFLMAIVFFVLIQMLFVAIFTKESIMVPLIAFSNFVNCLPYIFKPLADMVT